MTETLITDVAFAKMNGAGNDFILVDGFKDLPEDVDLSALAKSICRRKYSIGADGLIVLVPSKKADVAWRFYNADGSEAEMCGNGARCAARFAYLRGHAEKTLTLETIAGIIHAQLTDVGAKIGMTNPKEYRQDIQLTLPSGKREALFVDTGVPHAVIAVEDVFGHDVAEEGRLVRFDKAFAPAGTNANFIARLGEGRIKSRTYERGVEAETLACGTGAVAAALAATKLGWATSPVEVETSGGSLLTVAFKGSWGEASDVSLEGDAKLVYEGTWTQDALAGG